MTAQCFVVTLRSLILSRIYVVQFNLAVPAAHVLTQVRIISESFQVQLGDAFERS